MANVYVVDDDPVIGRLAEYILIKAGYTATILYDGQEALEAMERARPDVLLTDLMMPRLGGVALIERVRAHPAWAGLPIIVFTARSDVGDRQRAEQAGASYFLTKPFSSAQLLDAIRRFMPS